MQVCVLCPLNISRRTLDHLNVALLSRGLCVRGAPVSTFIPMRDVGCLSVVVPNERADEALDVLNWILRIK